jgi:hypothetical protein
VTSPISERLQFLLETAGGAGVVSEMQRIGQAGETSQTKLQQQVRNTETAFERQGRTGGSSLAVISDGANRSTTMLGRMSERLGVTESTLRTGLVTAAAVGFGALIVKAKESIDAYVDLAGEVRNFQRVSGASAEESSKFVAVLDDLQISADQGATAVARLARVDPTKLQEFGIQVAYAADGTTNLTETLLNVADAYAATKDPAERALIGQAAFGKAYRDLIPLLEQGRAGLAEYFAGVSDGQVLTQQQLDSTREYELALDALQDALGDLSRAAGETLVPALTAVFNIGADLIGVIDDIPGPIIQSTIAAIAFGAAASALSSRLAGLRTARAAESLASTATTISNVGTAAAAAEAPVGRFSRATGALRGAGAAGAALGASIPLLSEFATYLRSLTVQDVDVDRLATSLEYLGTVGGSSGLFADLGGIDGFKTDLQQVLDLQDATDGFWTSFTALDDVGLSLDQSTENVSALDEALASLVKGGNQQAAEEAFRQLATAAEEQGVPIETLRELFPEYANALEDVTLGEESAAAGANEHADAAQNAKEQVSRYSEAVDDLHGALETLNGQNRSLAEADIAVRDSMADLADAVAAAREEGNQLATSLSRTTQTGRDNESALIDQITAAQDFAEATANSTGSVKEGQKAFITQIGAIRDNMIALGFNRDEVDRLINRYGAMPDRVSTDVALRDFASGGIDSVSSKLASLDGKTATTYIRQITQYLIDSGAPKRATGGAVAAGADYLVGEVRPELFRPAVPGTIVPNTGAAGGSSSGGTTYHTEVYAQGSDARSIAREIENRQRTLEFLHG